MASPRSAAFGDFDLIMTFSKRFGEVDAPLQQDRLLVELAERLLEKGSALQVTTLRVAELGFSNVCFARRRSLRGRRWRGSRAAAARAGRRPTARCWTGPRA
jgi:hypothetical protein